MRRPILLGAAATALALSLFLLYRSYRKAYLSGAVRAFQEEVQEQEKVLGDTERREGDPPDPSNPDDPLTGI